MKTKQTLVFGFLAVMFALSLFSCKGRAVAQEQRITGSSDRFEFTSINDGNEYRISKKQGAEIEGALNIPAYYRQNANSDYLPVTEIGSFSGSKITSVTIPEGVTSIGNSAFSNCTNLANITIPASITSIGNDAFFDCTNLTSIAIPSSVVSIGNSAFSACSLTSITIPSGVTSIGRDAFSRNQLTSVTIPDSVTRIGDTAFGGNQLTSVTIGANVILSNFYGSPFEKGLFDNSFESVYNANGKAAGTYTTPNADSRNWTKQ